MARIIHELDCPPNKTEAAHREWLLIIRTIQAKPMKPNHNPGFTFDYGIRDPRIVSSVHNADKANDISGTFVHQLWTQYTLYIYSLK